jgi:hypothetical protein
MDLIQRNIVLNLKLDGTIPAAYLNIRGAAILVVFLDSGFGSLPPGKRADTYTALQAAAAQQDYAGEVAAVWEDHAGRTRFLAPAQQHPFFQVMNYGQLRAQVNAALQFKSEPSVLA